MNTINVMILAAAEILLTTFTQDLPKKLIIENSKIKNITPPAYTYGFLKIGRKLFKMVNKATTSAERVVHPKNQVNIPSSYPANRPNALYE